MTDASADIGTVLGLGHSSSLWQRWAWWIMGASAALVVVTGAGWWWIARSGTSAHFQTIAAKQGDLAVTVSTTGTVDPINQVQVGSELSGTVKSILVDYNDRVTKGQLLAEINTDQLSAQTQHAAATLGAQEADVLNRRAALTLAENNFERTQALSERGTVSTQQLETALANLKQARAAVELSEAQVKAAQADLAAYQTQLAKAEIRSPIDGIVLQRNIDPGQTVAASLQAPVLFVIANDLKQMRLLVDVDEADAGNVKPEQAATFTVEAYPDRSFPARVTQLRYDPITVSGVVTYKAVLEVNNEELLLRPGMTVAADITVKSVSKALLVPNAGLRYSPPASTGSTGFVLQAPGTNQIQIEAQFPSSAQKRVWILRDGTAVPVLVKLGSTDGNWTEVISGDLNVGDAIITGRGA